MNYEEIEQMLAPEGFAPFVIATKGGFSLAVSDPRNTLLGLGMLVIKHDGRLYHIALNAIDHIDQSGEQLG